MSNEDMIRLLADPAVLYPAALIGVMVVSHIAFTRLERRYPNDPDRRITPADAVSWLFAMRYGS